MTQADDIMIAKMSKGSTNASQVAQLTGIDLPDDDKEIVLQALKRLRNVASRHIYARMVCDYILAKAAIEALERMTE